MQIFETLKNDWSLFQKQVGNTKIAKWLNEGEGFTMGLKILLLLVGVVMVVFLGRSYPIIYSVIWVSIPTFLIIINLLRINLNKSFRKILIAVVLFQSFGIYLNRDDIQDFIGYNSIKGYRSHYETVTVNYGDYDDERETLVYECSHWTGKLIIFAYQILIIPLILATLYITWKMGQTIKE